MFKKILSFFLALTFSTTVFAASQNVQVEIWNTPEGLKRLERSQYKQDFYQLVNFYRPQINPLYCSTATAAAILSALNYGNIPSQPAAEVTRPEAMGGGKIEFPLYTQNTFFNEKTDKIKKRTVIDMKEPKEIVDGKPVYDPGLSLTDFSLILSKVYKVKTKVTYVEKSDIETINKFREVVKKVTTDKTHFMAVNFDGRVLGQKTAGHISSLAAYDEDSDSVLILDTALHKNPWYFVSLPKLVEAMNSKDGEKYRGYMLVSR